VFLEVFGSLSSNSRPEVEFTRLCACAVEISRKQTKVEVNEGLCSHRFSRSLEFNGAFRF